MKGYEMSDDNGRDPLQRLRAADPAADVEPRVGFAEEVVARAAAEQDEPAEVVEIAQGRRRRLWLPIAAVAASIAVFGGAGFAVGSATGGTTVAGGPGAPISLQNQGHGQSPQEQGSAASPKLSASGGADRAYPYGFGRNSFHSTGLSTSAGRAQAYGFDARTASTEKTVAALATALGVSGAPRLADGSWAAGPQDGSAPSLTVGLDGTLSFYYSNPQLAPAPCAVPGDTATPGDAATQGDAATPDACAATPALPAADAAIAALRTLVSATGRDPEAFQFASETPEGSYTRTAQAWPVLDGQRIDQSWSLELGTGGIVGVSGFLAATTSLGDYAIVSQQQAFERLSDPRFGASMTGGPIALRDQASSGEPSAPSTEPPAAPTSGEPLTWPVHRVEIVSARLGLASQWQSNGSVLVVPAYEFTDSDGGTWSVIAVADEQFDFSAF